jgi:hypothetical protein
MLSNGRKRYSPVFNVEVNRKGVLDADTVKGCTFGMAAYPRGGCYGECYAARNAVRCGIDFATSVSRQFCDICHRATIIKEMAKYPVSWYRVGTAGDPSHDWVHTIAVCRELRWTNKVPVIITKHWTELTEKQIGDLRWLKAVVNTSTSGLDTDAEIGHRVSQLLRLRSAGVRSVCRVVTCNFGTSDWARECRQKQQYLLSLAPVIDNPLRLRSSNPRLLNGDVYATRQEDSIGGGKLVSLHDSYVYLGSCKACPDQCGASN